MSRLRRAGRGRRWWCRTTPLPKVRVPASRGFTGAESAPATGNRPVLECEDVPDDGVGHLAAVPVRLSQGPGNTIVGSGAQELGCTPPGPGGLGRLTGVRRVRVRGGPESAISS
ncbi:hypothetical protein ACFPN0_25160 [Kitasatospora cinereorecta]